MDRETIGGIQVEIDAEDNYTPAFAGLTAAARRAGAEMTRAFGSMAGSVSRDTTRMQGDVTHLGAHIDRVLTGAANRFRLFGRDLRNISGALSVAGGFAGFLSFNRFVESAGSFEQTLNIIKELSGGTADEMARLSTQAQELGASTARSATEVAAGALELQKMGRSLSDITQILPSVTNFSIASDRSMQETAHTAGSVLTQFQLATSETERVMDVIARGANQSSADVGDFSIALSYAGQQAHNANLSLERTVALMEAASQGGIPGSRLGTGLQSLLNDIYMPNLMQQQVFRRFGIQVREATGEARDLYAVLNDIFTKLPQSAYGRFEVDTQNYLMTLRSQGLDSVRTREADLGLNSMGEAARVAGARMQGLKGMMDALSGAVDTLLIRIGQSGFLAAATDVIAAIGQWVSKLSDASASTLAMVGSIAALATVSGPLLFALGSILTLLTSPEGLIAAAIAATAAFALFADIKAEMDGAAAASQHYQAELERMAQLNAELAASTGEATEQIRQQRIEMSIAAQQRALQAEARVRDLERQRERDLNPLYGSWAENLAGGFARRFTGAEEELARARGEANAARQQADAIEAARHSGRRGSETSTGGGAVVAPHGGPMGGLGMQVLPSQQRARDLADLRAQAEVVETNRGGLARLQAAQQLVNQARQAGEGITLAAALAYQAEIEALQKLIAARTEERVETEKAAAQTGALLNIQRDLAVTEERIAAAAGGPRALRRWEILREQAQQGLKLPADQAEELARRMEDSEHRQERALERMRSWQQMFSSIGDAVAGAFEKAILEGGKLSDVLRGLARDIAAMVLRQTVTNPIARFISSSLSAVFGGGKAVGGNVWPGRAYEVGEMGRELFVPREAGTIVSNAQLKGAGGGGPSIVYAPQYSFTGTSEEIARLNRMAANDRAQFESRVRAVFGDMRSRGRA